LYYLFEKFKLIKFSGGAFAPHAPPHPLGVPAFRIPRAYHMARWMENAIYTLKLYLFRTEFK